MGQSPRHEMLSLAPDFCFDSEALYRWHLARQQIHAYENQFSSYCAKLPAFAGNDGPGIGLLYTSPQNNNRGATAPDKISGSGRWC